MKTIRILAAAALCAAALAGTLAAADIPARPEQLKYTPLPFDVPKADKYHLTLKNGISVYVVEDHTLPLVDVSMTLRTGAFLDDPAKFGVASLAGTMLRKGGAGTLNAEEFDLKADFLAAQLSSGSSDTQSSLSLNCLTSQLDPALDLLFAMLEEPRFQQDRIDVEKAQILESLKQRNDDAQTILTREWGWLLSGRDHYSSRKMTKAELDRITRDDLVAFHKTWWRAEGMTIAVSGDVNAKTIVPALEQRFAKWAKPAAGAPKIAWPPAPPKFDVKPGLYHVEKDIPQGKVFIGHRTFAWDAKWENPDGVAVEVMNEILGGGGFTSRITKRVRSDEGLAYSAGSGFQVGTFWPGAFRIFFQSKSATVAYAAKISLDEVKRMRETEVTPDELATARNGFIETFPRNFESAGDIARLFAGDDFIGRPHAYWDRYRDTVRKVGAAEVKRVASTYLHPDQMVFVVVGKWADIEKGDPGGKATMKDFFGGAVTHLPLRDPLTLEVQK